MRIWGIGSSHSTTTSASGAVLSRLTLESPGHPRLAGRGRGRKNRKIRKILPSMYGVLGEVGGANHLRRFVNRHLECALHARVSAASLELALSEVDEGKRGCLKSWRGCGGGSKWRNGAPFKYAHLLQDAMRHGDSSRRLAGWILLAEPSVIAGGQWQRQQPCGGAVQPRRGFSGRSRLGLSRISLLPSSRPLTPFVHVQKKGIAAQTASEQELVTETG